MKKSIILVFVAIFGILASCTKKDMSDNFNVDIQKYENLLNWDYNQANFYHLAIKSNGQKTLFLKSDSTSDSIFKISMYCQNDSLFSQHFYLFCLDMMQNSGMMNTSGGMMGSGGSMNGGSMGNMQDMNTMMAYMDSLHSNTFHSLNPNYLMNDSLIYNQLIMCKMMTNQTSAIENVFNNMQVLRKKHQMMY